MASNVTPMDVPHVSLPTQRPIEKDNPCYRAQSAARDVMDTHLFPCYSEAYVQSQQGLKGKALWCYSKAYNGASLVNRGARAVMSCSSKAGSGILSVGDSLLGWAVNPVINTAYPINPVNGHRHFVGIPRCIEKVLGDWVFYPQATHGMIETNELLPGTSERIADRVRGVLERIVQANGDVLNPNEESTKFNYRVKTVHSSQINAFAVPAGGMVVFTQLVRELDAAIKSGRITAADVEFADGSHARVDLKGVTLDDVLAALMGHEMTHVASRHSIVSILSRLTHAITLNLGRFGLITYLKGCDHEYQALKQKPESLLQEHERQALEAKEEFYSQISRAVSWVGEKFNDLIDLFHTRQHEYEADVTGTYFANRAKFNPLGAIFLQEILRQGKMEASELLHKHLEFMYTHPYGENRKRAILAAIHEIDPQVAKGRTHWTVAKSNYDYERSSPAIKYVHQCVQSAAQA
ncbi:MAG: M48 family metalloprotease [Chlamydiota bacterium]